MRWNPFSQHLKRLFPFKVAKITIDAGFTCPNIDGTLAFGGCTYCDNKSFSPNARVARATIAEQVRRGMEKYRSKGFDHFIAYFQANTNTHAPVPRLRELYDEALSFPEVVGLSIGTRPDCVADPVLDLVQSYASRVRVWLEMGVQTMSDEANRRTNRAHTWGDFVDAAARASGRGFELVAHTILGLPGDTPEGMRETAVELARLGVDSVKIHHLYVCPGTILEDQFRRGEVRVMDLGEYVSLVCDFIERLPERVSLQRLVGELDGPYVLAPRWGRTKSEILALFEAELEHRGTRQGSLAVVDGSKKVGVTTQLVATSGLPWPRA